MSGESDDPVHGVQNKFVIGSRMNEIKPPKRVFFDTEFSSLDANFRELISVGLVSESTDYNLYIVIEKGWQAAGVSPFVRDVVVPLLLKHEPEILSRGGAAARIEAWLEKIRGEDLDAPIHLYSDSPIDFMLLEGLFESGWASAQGVFYRSIQEAIHEINMNPEYDEAFQQFFLRRGHATRQRGGEQHHALVDARAMKHAFQAVQESPAGLAARVAKLEARMRKNGEILEGIETQLHRFP